MNATTSRAAHARTLFDGIASRYAWPAEVFSFGQYGRWRRAAIAHLDVPAGSLVLDVATGTGLVARDVQRRRGARVIGLDQSAEMLREAASRGVHVVGASATALPFAASIFDGLSFTYLLRYVDDVPATIAELIRVLRPGAPMVSVEFGMPQGAITGPLWRSYVLGTFPVAMRAISKGWREVGGFLGPSVASFNRRWPPERLADEWRAAGMTDVHAKKMSLGGGVITWGRKAR
jgi:demethylmenaquinone methyltransferase/2-methoxy-6-polyprenyl-1,4-benzoquinol methylase